MRQDRVAIRRSPWERYLRLLQFHFAVALTQVAMMDHFRPKAKVSQMLVSVMFDGCGDKVKGKVGLYTLKFLVFHSQQSVSSLPWLNDSDQSSIHDDSRIERRLFGLARSAALYWKLIPSLSLIFHRPFREKPDSCLSERERSWRDRTVSLNLLLQYRLLHLVYF